MDLTTTYMGLELKSPLVPSASPFSEDIDRIKEMEDAGASAVVMHSLFEEQLQLEHDELHHHLTQGSESYAEALTYFPKPLFFRVDPEEYLDHIRKSKEKVSIPIIASLNGSSLSGWTSYASKIQQAGADALELNIYYVPTDMDLVAQQIEETYIDIFKAVKATVTIPVAVKLSPFFTNIGNMAKRLDAAGANALVLFNRFYQPDINLKTLEVEPHILLSTPEAMRLPLRWIAILHGRIHASLAATSGIYTGVDAIKMLMAGANITMLCSVLLQHGINHIPTIEGQMRKWMEEHEYESVKQLQGSMSQQHCSNPSVFERVQYMRAIQTLKPGWRKNIEPSHYFG
ncbi:dihydroorotate dehydrogenase-like protein [Scytonema sp. UIC 10036]|uniref:dihydroorotate dehydrogenase-like protein n=1 Tax=Scytonema sp. UIC 10036 TaxID=2304196 RepID=UPI0013844B7F|nr:dihydroorotate dehydrogenase-like protein [Scytonema sp. UIC 10036]